MHRREGFSMIEVIVALMLLTIAILGLQLVAANMVRQTSQSQVRLSAAQLAEDRIDLIKLEPVYANIGSYAATETTISGFPNYTRVTTVSPRRDSTAAGVTDYKRVSVAVRGPGLPTPIVRTLTVGAP